VDKNDSEVYRVEWFSISGAPRILLILRRVISWKRRWLCLENGDIQFWLRTFLFLMLR
jgi:hypothetical protein